MPLGPGKYKQECTLARKAAGAKGAILIVYEGKLGHGFEVQLPMEVMPGFIETLEEVVVKIKEDWNSGNRTH